MNAADGGDHDIWGWQALARDVHGLMGVWMFTL